MLRTPRLLLLLLFMPSFAAAQAAAKPDVILRGELTGQDNKTWRLVPFEVPSGVTRITVEFDYTGRDERTIIDLGIVGPDGFRGQDGFRGWSGGNKASFTISASDATPSYLAGPIRAGQWNLLLGVPNIRARNRSEYSATIRFGRATDAADAGLSLEPPLRQGPGWFRGDLHMHTGHSDGSCASQQGERVPCPLFLTARTAAERGLDFIAITDHNTLSHVDSIREIQPYFDNLLLMPGREITTHTGHANLFGSLTPFDFRVGDLQVPDWNVLLGRIAAKRGVISINHPIRPSGEECMGCGWTPRGEVDYSLVQAVEAVNGLDADTPFSGVPFWQQLLNRGYHLTAIGGSDNHDALRPAVDLNVLGDTGSPRERSADLKAKLQRASGAIGTPTTVVYADALSQPAIIEGIRRGRVFIDVAGSRTRALELVAKNGAQTAAMGDVVESARGITVHFDGRVRDLDGGRIDVIIDGQSKPVLRSDTITGADYSFSFQWRSDGGRHWVRVDARDGQGRRALIGNPIYISPNRR